jgi:hypothetical protein
MLENTLTSCNCILFVLLIGVATALSASPAALIDDATHFDLVISTNEGAELNLEVIHMPLSEVLDKIAFKSKMPIHYSILPKGFVSATCVGSTLKQILGCLLGEKTDFIISYSHQNNAIEQHKQPTEAWILGSRLEDSSAATDCAFTTSQKNNSTVSSESDQTDNLLIMTQSEKPAERESAMSALLVVGKIDDPNVKAALEQGLTDQDAGVRAQAISSFAQREGRDAAAAIQLALHDNSADVRLMAVDAITDDVALLQLAIKDKDEVIRKVAELKLAALMQAK